MVKKINTMEEFAVLAGVSRPTASKYFHQSDSVSARSRKKIEHTLNKVNYRRNLLASSLMRKNSRIIGVLIPSLGDPYYASIIHAIEMYALEYGYMVMIECSYGDSELENKAIDNFLAVKVSGICYAPVGIKILDTKLQRLEKELPIVFIDALFEGAENYVKNNNEQSIGLITRYMVEKGRHPMYFSMPTINSNAQERLNTYCNTMISLDQQPLILPVSMAEKTWSFEEWAKNEMLRMIEDKKLISNAIICSNDRVAFGVLSALFSKNKLQRQGNGFDISVSGHDNHPLSSFTCPPLTTVEQDVKQIGKIAIDIIMSKIGNLAAIKKTQQTLNAKLILRESA